jgi:NadR type nicotinamide-nucleotide adenylyltransferase
MKRFARGLVVGKFAPLHRGHELLINAARAECDEVVIISYSKPEFGGCEPEKRERWLRELFPECRRLVVTDDLLSHYSSAEFGCPVTLPHNADDASKHRRFVGFLCQHVLGVPIDAVFTSEDYGVGFALELTDYLRALDPAAPEVSAITLDVTRTQIAISGTQIRANVHAAREYLAPAVYADFVRRVCILGGESSGKSSLARALAEHFQTNYVAEYGRELWELRAGALSFEDMLHIAEQQLARERSAARNANMFLFCDTSPLTTLFYSRQLFKRVAAELEQLATTRYDLTVLCAPDFPFVQDGTRQDAAFRELQHEFYLAQLSFSRNPWLLVVGTIEQRISQITNALENLYPHK